MIPERSAACTGNMNSLRAIFAAAGFFFVGALSGGIAAQSVAPIPAPAAMPASPAPAAPIAAPAAAPAKQVAAQDNANATKAPKKKKVFTDDDVSALRAKSHLANDDSGTAVIYGAVGACDADCEEEVKEKLGITPEQEGEWKLQVTAARREIGEDHAWTALYARGQHTMHDVCVLRTQIENAAVPSGNDYQSRVERAKVQKMFEDEEEAMGQRMANDVAAMNQHLSLIHI